MHNNIQDYVFISVELNLNKNEYIYKQQTFST